MRSVVLLGILVGCGSPNADSDGGVGDAASDTVAPGQVRVTVLVAPSSTEPVAVPRAGDDIVFSDNDQTQVIQTDANGQATATVSGPATITAVHRFQGAAVELVAVMGVMPGEDIVLRRPGADYTEVAPLVVTFPPSGSFEACGPCGCVSWTSIPTSLQMIEHCQSSTVPVTFLEYQNQRPVSFGTTTATYDRVAGGSVTMPAQLAPTRQYPATFTNVTSRVTRIAVDFTAGHASTRAEITSPSTTSTTQVTGWDATAHFSAAFVDGNSGAYQYLMSDIEGPTDALEVNVSTDLLPWLSRPTFDPSSRTFDAMFTNGTAPDLFVGDVSYLNPNNTSIIWTVFAAAPGTFVLPSIPSSVVDTTVGSTVFPSFSYLFASDSIAGYAEARRDPFSVRSLLGTDGLGTVRGSYSPEAR